MSEFTSDYAPCRDLLLKRLRELRRRGLPSDCESRLLLPVHCDLHTDGCRHPYNYTDDCE